MFTVVITEQARLDSIQEYKAFLAPFLRDPNVAWCRWNTGGEVLADMVPELAATVSRHQHWRLIAVCPDTGIDRKNPFDLVDWVPLREKDFPDTDSYLTQLQQAKHKAYAQAARQPLTRLMTWLCQSPMVTSGLNNAQEDPEFAAYVADSREKERLRRQILGDSTPEFALPEEVICLSLRCCPDTGYDVLSSWTQRPDSLYSRFYDRNLYFDRMRYLLFDILPKNHRNYPFDYIRFLYTLMLLACNDTPQSALKPNWVYRLECETDEAALCALLGDYEQKLVATEEYLRTQYEKLEQQELPRLSDRDARTLYCAGFPVSVPNTGDFPRGELYVSTSGIGLAGDCPTDEQETWRSRHRSSRRALGRFLKTPGRALRKATAQLHLMSTADLEQAGRLDSYQLEEVADFTREEEMRMIASPVTDMAEYTRQLDAQNQRILDATERRMTRRWTIILGVSSLVIYLLGLLPLLFTNSDAQQTLTEAMLYCAIGGGCLLLVGFITLFFLRRPVIRGYRDYNAIMRTAETEADASLERAGVYLTHACNMMRGYSVLNYRRETERPEVIRMRLCKKHMLDVERVRQELEEVFGIMLPENPARPDVTLRYPYDFSRPVDFSYPIPYTAGQKSRVDFLQKGHTVEVPVDFVRSLQVRREELYE